MVDGPKAFDELAESVPRECASAGHPLVLDVTTMGDRPPVLMCRCGYRTETPVTTLTDFLLARIAEDEKCARQRGQWRTDTGGCCVVDSEDGDTIAEMVWDNAAHVARHDPARVLAECEAKRRIVAGHEPSHDGRICLTCRGDQDEWDSQRFPCETLRLLAAVYADHPDYRPEWRP